ncbi:uncharacterized protein C12orf73 homolog isoform X1 [Cricetulus griseus]|uniref:Uncharacterized protein C12orf73 homolog isoform X1 n=1 Tax=Cricetulus griseus TaxID=10029 RepID=A0A9J7F661_CRIGR|nr:uncharacterized protein C12orf73 homolog isoform X1 [Cricetulus griseus]XP_027248344.1 uncharacterized protein C12orf73 homolog isoform X1 [Cricetulus griseus]
MRQDGAVTRSRMAKAWKRSRQNKSRKIKTLRLTAGRNTRMRTRAHFPRFPLRRGAGPLHFGSGPWRSAPYRAGTSGRPGPVHSPLCTMPGGVPWSAYLKMLSSSLLAMCAGAQVVHWYYRPDLVMLSSKRPQSEGQCNLHVPSTSHQHQLAFQLLECYIRCHDAFP